MKNTKQYLISEADRGIAEIETEIKKSDDELEILRAKLKVENKALGMKDIDKNIKEDFKYSAQALQDMIAMEEDKNIELKKDLEVSKYRKEVIEDEFSDNELDRA